MNLQEPLAKYDPVTHSLKTARPSLLEDLMLSSPTLPRSGMMRNGIVSRLPRLEPLTCEIESGLWRTPNASIVDAKSSVKKLTGRTPSDPQVGLADQVAAAERGMWPTPTVSGNYNRKGLSKKSGDGLATAVRKSFPTPNACSGNNSGRLDEWGGHNNPFRGTVEGGGKLNPDWVEWLMGLPIGWTDLKESATAKCLTALATSDT